MRHVAGRNEQTGLFIDDEVAQAADVTCDDRRRAIASAQTTPKPSRREGQATTARPTVEPLELVVRHEAERSRNLVPEGPSPATTSGRPLAAATSSRTPFSSESLPAEDLRRVGLLPTAAGTSTPLGMTRTSSAPSFRASSASAVEGAITSLARPTTRRASTGATGELDVGSPHLGHERLPGRHRNRCRTEPVCVHEVGAAGRRAARANAPSMRGRASAR